MNHFPESSGVHSPQMLELSKPFVSVFTPFIGTGKSSITPNVRKNIPYIGISGFTLIEVVVTLAVVAILAMVAAPNISTIIQNNRMSALTNDLISDINTARSEALKTGNNVGICMSQTGAACDGASWQAGRMIFVDTNNNGVFDAPGDTVVRAQSRMNNNTLNTPALPNPLFFSPRGLPLNFGAGGNFLLCDQRGPTHGRSIQISPTGQVGTSTTLASCS